MYEAKPATDATSTPSIIPRAAASLILAFLLLDVAAVVIGYESAYLSKETVLFFWPAVVVQTVVFFLLLKTRSFVHLSTNVICTFLAVTFFLAVIVAVVYGNPYDLDPQKVSLVLRVIAFVSVFITGIAMCFFWPRKQKNK